MAVTRNKTLLSNLKQWKTFFSHTFSPSPHLSSLVSIKKHKGFGIFLIEYENQNNFLLFCYFAT